MKREKRYLYLDDFEHRLAIEGMNHFRNNLIRNGKPTEDIDALLDELHRPRKNANSRKSMVSLFVYLILKQHSDSEHPLKQQEILSYLAEEPYEIVVERKALSRVIQNLKSSQLGIYTDKHRGSWFMGGDA